MKIPLWYLLVLLASLFSPGRGDCQGECVACSLLLPQQQLQQAFNTMVCLFECEGHVSSSLTWEVCKRAVKLSHHPTLPEGGALLKRTGEQLQLTSLDLNADGDLLQSAAVEPFQEGAPFQRRSVQYDSPLLGSFEEQEEEEEDEEEEGGPGLRGLDLDDEREARDVEGNDDEQPDDEALGSDAGGSEAVALSKRFGGFQRGRHGYRKLIGSPMRPLQKRYGGFIGVRKSARKWNSQKRVNQLLRQYLGMRSSRSGRFNPVTRVWRQNKL